jgi:hypothetical protein
MLAISTNACCPNVANFISLSNFSRSISYPFLIKTVTAVVAAVCIAVTMAVNAIFFSGSFILKSPALFSLVIALEI